MSTIVCKKRLSRFLVLFFLFFPMAAYAHLISITPTTPFPATVAATSRTTATFTVTNIASRISVTVIDQSNFPSSSGLSVSSSTCGSLLAPGQSCTIQVSLQAPSAGRVISAELKEWAQPSADGVQYPINVTVSAFSLPNITLVPVNSSALPALREPIVATSAGSWLIMSGALGGFHDFNNNFNPNISVYNPNTQQINSVSVSSTNLPIALKNQLASSDPEFLQDGNTLYVIGGFYTPDNVNWTTLNTITAINISGMMNAVINGQTNLAAFVATNSIIPQFKVAGGQLGKIGSNFYLTFGQDCEGAYCATSQTYTNSIYQFITDPTLATTAIINTVSRPDLDGSGFRRRDYTLAPFMLGSTPTLFAMGGPFTPGNEANVWTNGINFNANLQANINFINQQANQYSSPNLSMYSTNSNVSYVATFSGLSNLYWSTSGLVYDNTTPYGNILDLITSDASGNVQEYANMQPLCSGQPLASCLYMGLAGQFIPVANNYDSRSILQLDQLPQNSPTLVGYVYAGLVSSARNIFVTPDPTTASNQVYAVYVTPAGSGAVNWQSITNLFPGN
jgi:hypothetical protein